MRAVNIELLFLLQGRCLLRLGSTGLNIRLTPKKKRKQFRERDKWRWVHFGFRTWSVTWRECTFRTL